ncbi:endoplasmin homolog [Olea europaea subsp. europaea]|uniref:Endoplasmin homolog n=1 Tax=Olea europaea subsp. europaea TaxID=158383 RepID=A0A8S0PR21_OLEEU|nr:endoplasmin homolog [Olea europaea subsp. europaea]
MKLNPMRKGRKKRMRENPRQRQLKKTTYEWELLNDVRAIWLRNPKEDFSDEKPLGWSHFSAEGDVEFKAIWCPRLDSYCDLWNQGLVDYDTLPLNVSGEMLQQNSSLKTIKKTLIRKALDMICKLDEEDPDESNDKDKKDCGNWQPNYRLLLVPDLVMKLNDVADNEESSDSNEKKECVQGLKIEKDSKDKELKESFKELTKWWKGALASENIDHVKISNRLADTQCVVVTSKYDWSAHMERIMQPQTISDASKQAYKRGKRVLEINRAHQAACSVKTSLNISLDVTVEEKNPILNPGLKRQNLLRTLKIVLKITMMMLTTNCRSMILESIYIVQNA